jgi:cytochrome o ubiquinol oxidase operon protein cyoD
MSTIRNNTEGNLASYVIGFISSIILTLFAYLAVVNQRFQGWNLVYAIATLALAQCLVQLLCFLHLGRETKPRWKLAVFSFMLLVIIIFVFGSLWIMSNLHYRRVSSPTQVNTYLHDQDGI